MPVTERDPWAGTGRPTGQRRQPKNTVEHMEAVRPSLMARAKKREVLEDPWLSNVWSVTGDSKLGDVHHNYEVVLNGKKYDCTCHTSAHGETRARRMCSHVLAVILYRREHPSSSAGDAPVESASEARAEEGSTPSTSAPADTFDESETDVTAWDPRDERLTPARWSPLPEWVTQIREHQWRAALEVVEAIENGAGLVFVDAPTGSGKTLLGDLIARLLGQPAIYLCTTKSLQDQVLEDYPYAAVLKGKANYRTMHKPFPEYTADDCDGSIEKDDCSYCDPMVDCAYRVAKSRAIRSQLAVMNMAYWLREANLVRRPAFSLPPDPTASETATGRRRREGGLFILDECDTLEDQLLGFIEFSVSKRRARELGVEAPRKGSHKNTVRKWLRDELVPAIESVIAELRTNRTPENARKMRGYAQMLEDAQRVELELEDENWIRDYSQESTPLSYKPVTVDGYGPRMIWQHGGRMILMSATIISPEEMVETLGYTGEWAVVRVPMTFPVENRPIHVAPVANMVKKDGEEERGFPALLKAIGNILDKHPDDRTLIHTVSYGRAEQIMRGMREHRRRRTFLTYRNASEREEVLAVYRNTPGAVLLAPSFERGIDLAGEDCRVQIVAKIPYPNMGDPRVSARSHGPGGDAWIAVQTIRALVQMTGRGVRSADDYCTTYILDKQFVSNVWRRNKNLFPAWWAEAVNLQFRTRDLLK